MLTTMRCWRILVVIVWCQGFVGPLGHTADDVALPEPIKVALGRPAALTTISFKWTERYDPSDLARERLKASMVRYLSAQRNQYRVWQRGLMYRRTITGDDTDEFAFDGRIVAGGRFKTGDDSDRVLRKDLASDLNANADYFGMDVLECVGIRFPQGVARLIDRKPLQSSVLFEIGQGARIKSVEPVEIDDRPMQRISLLVENPTWRKLQDLDLVKTEAELHKSPETEESIQKILAAQKRAKETTPPELIRAFDVDPEIGYAVRRWRDLTVDGRLRTQADCTEHERLSGYDLWLPKRCRIDYFTSDEDYGGEIFDEPFLTKKLELSEFDTKLVPDELFMLNYNVPGARITDATLPESKLGNGPVSYTIPVDLKDLDRAVDRARKLLDVQSERKQSQSSLRLALIVGNTIAVVVAITYFVIRKRSQDNK